MRNGTKQNEDNYSAIFWVNIKNEDSSEAKLHLGSKEHFTSLFSPARERAFTSKNIKAGFAASGLFPFNLDRVLRHMLKPPADLTITKAGEVEVGSCL
jgi:hypothetical protein